MPTLPAQPTAAPRQVPAEDLRPVTGLALLSGLSVADLSARLVAAHDDPDPAHMFMQLFYLLQALGQTDFALDMQAQALARRRIFRLQGPTRPALRLLALMVPGDMRDNTPIEFLLSGSDIQLELCYLCADAPLPNEWPDHDILMVAIGESDATAELLTRLAPCLASWPRPVINQPTRILGCARDAVAARLHGIPELRVPTLQRVDPGESISLPLPYTLRPLDTHAGVGLARIDDDAGLSAYLAAHPAPGYYATEYVDYRSADGLYRKFRVALIDGQPYGCHLAIGDHWIVHFIKAGMHLSEARRAEEEAALTHFATGFGARHGSTLREVARRLGLDHVVLDCADTADGRLLLFEADSRAWIHATDPVDIFPYKPPLMQRAFDGFRAMLHARVAQAGGVGTRSA